MDNLTRYTIEFRYNDNDQLSSNDVLVTRGELKRVRKFFAKMLDEGYIQAADGTDSDEIDNIVFERSEAAPLLFDQLRASIEDGDALKSYGKSLGIEL
jgi:hypothetical protein